MPRFCQEYCQSPGLLVLSKGSRVLGWSEGCGLENSHSLWFFVYLFVCYRRPKIVLFVPWCFSVNNATHFHLHAAPAPSFLSEVKGCSRLFPLGKFFHKAPQAKEDFWWVYSSVAQLFRTFHLTLTHDGARIPPTSLTVSPPPWIVNLHTPVHLPLTLFWTPYSVGTTHF